MVKVAFFGYRDWAIRIFENLRPLKAILEIVDFHDADVLLYYGWSEIISKGIYKNKLCLILHPSPLPKYRGGSPIQHQIINGEVKSAITICRVTDKLDSGGIYSQTPFSLEGSLNDIFDRIVKIGTRDTVKVLKQLAAKTIKLIPQDENKATVYKRRTPGESELFPEDFRTESAKDLYNFIRALNDPYPNAYIKCGDGKKLYFTGAHL